MAIPWPLFKKAAQWLFGGALLTAFAVTALYRGHQIAGDTWRIVFILALGVLTVTSAVLLPGVLLPNVRSPHPEFLSDDLQDEWRDLQQHTISRPHVLMVAGVVAALVYVWCVLYYGKLTNAFWFGWLPVGAAAVLLALLVVAFARRTGWYNDRLFETPTWVILVAFAGFALALFLGIFMTEQIVTPRPAAVSAPSGIDYGYVGSRAYNITRQYVEIDPVPDVAVPDCDDDACGYVFLFILFLALTLILVAGAALIPHMWVLSCLVLLTVIALLVLHEVHRDRTLTRDYRDLRVYARLSGRAAGGVTNPPLPARRERG